MNKDQLNQIRDAVIGYGDVVTTSAGEASEHFRYVGVETRTPLNVLTRLGHYGLLEQEGRDEPPPSEPWLRVVPFTQGGTIFFEDLHETQT